MTEEKGALLLDKAVLNNAKWCDVVCRANNLACQFDEDIWYTVPEPPEYYPNVVTLRPNVSVGKIKLLMKRRKSGKWFIKDSYGDLDLKSVGLNKLFDAEWIVAPKIDKADVDKNLACSEVDNGEGFKVWESAAKQSFAPTLLRNGDIKFIAIYSGNEVVAGGIIYISDGILGLSNVFAPRNNPARYWLALLGTVQERFPDWHVIDYEVGHDLEQVKNLGFNSIGPLSIWTN